MTRNQFRAAAVKAKKQMLYGVWGDADYLSPLEQTVAAALRKMWSQVDLLASRQSGFTPDARSRIACYPL